MNGVWKVAFGLASTASHKLALVTAAPITGPFAATMRGWLWVVMCGWLVGWLVERPRP